MTLTTTALGDFTPTTDLGKAILVVYAAFGIGFMFLFLGLVLQLLLENTTRTVAHQVIRKIYPNSNAEQAAEYLRS
jgi:hypothetical protein